MIWESSDWKQPLLETATWLRRVRLGPRTRHQTFAKIEKQIFSGFYGIRKLLDTYKISDSTRNTQLQVFRYPNVARVHYFNWHRVDQLYDLNTEQSEQRDIRFICNIFVHSHIFLPIEEDDGRIHGFYVTPDQDRNDRIYRITLDDVCRLFRKVGRDYPNNLRRTLNEETGEYDVEVW